MDAASEARVLFWQRDTEGNHPRSGQSVTNLIHRKSLILVDESTLTITVIAIVSDFVLASYPIFILRKIQMSLRSKVGLCILMGLGIMSVHLLDSQSDAHFRNRSTGALCMVRTVLNWQNINDDPTCEPDENKSYGRC